MLDSEEGVNGSVAKTAVELGDQEKAGAGKQLFILILLARPGRDRKAFPDLSVPSPAARHQPSHLAPSTRFFLVS